MKMLNDKVLLKLLEREEEQRGGLIIVNKQTQVELCEVLEVSEEECEIKAGDKVLVAKDRIALTPYGYLVDRKDVACIVEL